MINISEHLKKEFWHRRWVGDKTPPPPTNPEFYAIPERLPHVNRRNLTQDDFANEISVSAHNINSLYQSARPIREAFPKYDENGNPVIDKDGNPVQEWRIVGYDDLETTRYGLQYRFAMCKTAHFAGNGWGIYNEQMDKSETAHNRYDTLCSWRDIAGLDMAFVEVVKSCFTTGDGAIYLYQDGNNIAYEVFSFNKGDVLFPDYDENHFPVLYRLYTLKGRQAVDIFGAEYIETWVLADVSDKGKSSANRWFAQIRGWFKSHDFAISEDGWTRISRRKTQTGSIVNACVYFRIDDIPSGIVQEDIEALERSASYVAEGVKAAAFDTLFIKATNIQNLPEVGSFGSVIGVTGNVEELKASDAKRLPPSNISDVATIDLKEKKESILHSSMSVILDPDVLRSGADSSSAMRLCFNDEVKWCMAMQPQFYKPLKQLTSALKAIVAKIEKDPEYASLRVSVGMNIWTPNNVSEAVENATKLVYAGVLSRENARHELDINYPDDLNIVYGETERELYQKTYTPLKAKYDAQKEFGIADVANDIVVGNSESVPQTANDKRADSKRAQADQNAYAANVDNNANRKPIDI